MTKSLSEKPIAEWFVSRVQMSTTKVVLRCALFVWVSSWIMIARGIAMRQHGFWRLVMERVSITLFCVSAASAQQDLLVGDPASHTVWRYDGRTGALLGEFVSSGSGGLGLTWGLTFGPDGHLYVSDGSNGRILRFDGSTGSFIDVFAQGSGLVGPTHLLFHGDDVFVALWNQAAFRGGIAPSRRAVRCRRGDLRDERWSDQ